LLCGSHLVLLTPQETSEISKNQEDLGRSDRILAFDKTRTAWKTTRPTILLLLCVFVAAVIF
jgi:hypothetical protein